MQHCPWESIYPEEFSKGIDVDEASTLVDIISKSLEVHLDRTAATCLDERITYLQLKTYSTSLAAYFQSIGLRKGDRVALMMPNSLPYLIALVGIMKAGMVVVNVNPLYTPRELEYQLKDSGARCLVVAEQYVSTFGQVAINTQVEHDLSAPVDSLVSQLETSGRKWAEYSESGRGPSLAEFKLVSLVEAIAHGGKRTLLQEFIAPNDMAFLQYTGGTTGRSKGAILSHKSVSASLRMILAWLGSNLPKDGASIVLPLPMYHIYPLSMALFSMASGLNLRLIPNPRDPASVIDELKRAPFEIFIGVNTLFNSLVNDPGLQSVDFSRTQFVIGAGASVQSSVVSRWISLGGGPVTEAYGLTETSPCVMFNPPGRNGTIGVPMPSTSVRIIDESGNAVPFNVAGELLLKGPQLFSGYWRNEEETRKAFTEDGWFKTGDVVTMDEDGFMYVVDRKKDMILVSGFNVYPNEIEEVVASHPGVLECACIGVPDDRSGEAPYLFVVPRKPGISVEQIKEFCRLKLTAYKIPRHISFVNALPKSAVGKILRKDLRERVGEELEQGGESSGSA